MEAVLEYACATPSSRHGKAMLLVGCVLCFMVVSALLATLAALASSDEVEHLLLVRNANDLALAARAAHLTRPSNRAEQWLSDAEARGYFQRYAALKSLGKHFDTDKVHHGFLSIYADLFGAREAVRHVLEIGVFRGASLQMWRDYFSNAIVHGVDSFTGQMGNGDKLCDGSCVGDLNAQPFGARVELLSADQGNVSSMEQLVAELSRRHVECALTCTFHLSPR